MSKSKKKHAHHEAVVAEPAEKKAHDDDFVYVPRGKSRGMYIFILGLMVFTLIIFVVPGGLQSLMDPRGAATDTFMSWEHPRLGKRQVSLLDFTNQKRELALFYQLLGARNDELYNDEATAAFLVSDALAEEAGVQFGPPDLAEWILQVFGSKEIYTQRLARATTPAKYEAMARKILRVQRYQSLIMNAAAVPSTDQVEKTWNERHEQFAFDAIGLAVEPLLATARSEATDEAALRDWYESRPPRSGAFFEDWVEARAAVELAGWPVDSEDPVGLLEKYPAPEETDYAALARQYYDSNFHTRFLRDEPGTAEDGRPNLYFSFEEVEEQAAREAPIHRALGLWREDLSGRIVDGEDVDLAAEAAALGLTFVPAGELRPIGDWSGAQAPGAPEEELVEVVVEDPFTGRFVEDGILRADLATGLSPRQIVEQGAMLVTRVSERVEAGPAAFEDVKEKVVEEWAKERASEIALERVREAYDALAALDTSGAERPTADAAAFGAQAAGMGAAVQHRDWFDPSARVPSGQEEASLEKYTRRMARGLMLEEGQLAEPQLDLAMENAWMLRGAGRRPPPELEIEPAEYQGIVQMSGYLARQSIQELLSFGAFEQLYALRLDRPDRERDGGEGEGGEGPEG